MHVLLILRCLGDYFLISIEGYVTNYLIRRAALMAILFCGRV